MINQSRANIIASVFTERFGLSLSAKFKSDESGIKLSFIPDELHAAEGFTIVVSLGWRSLSAEFVPGSFSAPLIKAMGEAECEKKAAFKCLAGMIIEENGHILMKVNNIPVEPVDIDTWPKEWNNLRLSLKYLPIAFDEMGDYEIEQYIINHSGKLIGMLISLLPIDDEDSDVDNSAVGLPEGASTRIEVNRYERNRLNRAICIEKKGAVCSVCGFDFENFYGTVGMGFIHVHHITPVSQLGGNYIIDPVRDLVPVCPNCHAMLHRADPPYSIDELKLFMHLYKETGKGELGINTG